MDEDEVVETIPLDYQYWFAGEPGGVAIMFQQEPTPESVPKGFVIVHKEYAHRLNLMGKRVVITNKAKQDEEPVYDISFLTLTDSLFASYEQKFKTLSSQNKAISDRNDFLEDCIAEMASVVYNSDIAMQALNN